jgi:anti-sigma factor RsiW
MSTLRDISRRDLERLSSYIDGELPERELARMEARLKIDPALQRAMLELQQAVELVRGLPEKEPPRGFALTPDMVQAPPGRFSILSFSTALAAVIFVAVVGVDVLSASVGLRSLQAARPVGAFEAQREVQVLPTLELEPSGFADTEGEALAAEAPASEDAMADESIAEEALPQEVAAETPAAQEAEGASSLPEEPSAVIGEQEPADIAGQEVDRAAEGTEADFFAEPDLAAPEESLAADNALKLEDGELGDGLASSEQAPSARTVIFRITELILGILLVVLSYLTFRRARQP